VLFLELSLKSDFLSRKIFQGMILLFSELKGEKDSSKTFCRMENFEEHNAVICFDASHLRRMAR